MFYLYVVFNKSLKFYLKSNTYFLSKKIEFYKRVIEYILQIKKHNYSIIYA